MKETVNEYRFVEGFKECNRENNFSYEGRKAMYEYFTEMEHDGFEIEYDPIAICCEYSEYESIKEYNENYGTNYESFEELEDEGDHYIIRFDIYDYSKSVMEPDTTEHIIVGDYWWTWKTTNKEQKN